MNYRKNDEIRAVIDGLGNEGEGISHVDGFPFFIKDTAPGDIVTAKVMKVKSSFGYAKLLEIEQPSECRVRPECPVALKCGGCSLQHISYEEELRYKDEKVYNCLLRIGGIPAKILDRAREPIVPSEKVFRYRNKAQCPVGRDSEGRAVAGFYSGRTHHIVPEDDCALSPALFKVVIRTVTDIINEYGISVYNEETGKGLIRHILIRMGFGTGELMTCIVSSGEKIPHIRELSDALMGIPGMKSVCLNINPEKTNVILGKKIIPLRGKPFIEDVLCGLRFRISPLSFYQVNPLTAEKLYSCALDYAGLEEYGGPSDGGSFGGGPSDGDAFAGGPSDGDAFAGGSEGAAPSRDAVKEVWDLCCGIGTITLAAASRSDKLLVHGVEIVEEAVKDARVNAELNGIENADFTAAAAEEYLPRYLIDHPGSRADVVILDPPRKGVRPEVLESIAKLLPERVVYVSCDPATLARDLKTLLSAGYRLSKYRVFDQFSRTAHVEVCCLLEQLRPAKEHIEITINAEDYYRIKDSEKKQDE